MSITMKFLVAVGLWQVVQGRVQQIEKAEAYNDFQVKQVNSERTLGLMEKWHIGDRPEFKYDSLDFDLVYEISDFVQDGNIQYTVFDGHQCQEGNNNITNNQDYLSSIMDPDDTPLGDGLGSRNIEISLTINPETISTSPIYEHVENEAQAYVYFCIRFGVYTSSDGNGGPPLEVNFLETPVLLIVNLADNFEISLSQLTNADLVVELAEQGNAVLGYICDSKDNVVPHSTIKSQGVEVKVCIEPTNETLTEGGYLRYLESFTFKRGNTTQVAIAPGTGGVAVDESTVITCQPGSTLCSFQTILSPEFFDSPGIGIVQGEGLAFLQFGTGSGGLRRSLVGQAAALEANPTTFKFEVVALPRNDTASSAAASVISLKFVATLTIMAVTVLFQNF